MQRESRELIRDLLILVAVTLFLIVWGVDAWLKLFSTVKWGEPLPVVEAQAVTSFPPDGPAVVPYEERISYSGGLPEYKCIARAQSPTSTIGVLLANSGPADGGGATPLLTQIVVSGSTATATTSAAHGLAVGHRITISGGTTDTDLNGNFTIATVASSTTFAFTVANVTAGTYVDSGLKISTTAPRETMGVWSIERYFISGGAIVRRASAWGSNAGDKACTLAASYWQ